MSGVLSGIIQKSGLSESEVDARVVAKETARHVVVGPVADDAATSIDLGRNVFAGSIIITDNSSATYRGILAFRAASSSAFCVAISASSGIEVTTGALTGTDGTDNKVTVSTHTDNKIYIENRSGVSAAFGVTIGALRP